MEDSRERRIFAFRHIGGDPPQQVAENPADDDQHQNAFDQAEHAAQQFVEENAGQGSLATKFNPWQRRFHTSSTPKTQSKRGWP